MTLRTLLFCLICSLDLSHGMVQAENLLIAQDKESDSSLTSSAGVAESGASSPKNSFGTRYAYFEPADFIDLPGWQYDDFGAAWMAFRQSCVALQKKSAWEALCKRSSSISRSDDEALRHFFEQEFDLYQIHNNDKTPAGLITGYYEPLLTGNRSYSAQYRYPVYAVPDDLLYLDARALPVVSNAEIRVRVEGRNVVPTRSSGAIEPGTYKLELTGVQPDIRSRRYRLRIKGDRVVPYFTRREIESGQMLHPKVIVWVDNAAALYSMQIQGSGKVRLPGGEIVRVAFGEQNGHPFLPSMQSLPQQVASNGKWQVIRTRGLTPSPVQEGPALAEGASDRVTEEALEPEDIDTANTHRTRGLVRPPHQQSSSAELDRVIESLLPPSRRATAGPPNTASAARLKLENEGKTPAAAPQAQRARISEESATELLAPGSVANAIPNSDPSYVFFRPIPESNDGPIGALGVPLTAGRSVAVDPRTTPLGFPVFISTRQPGRTEALNRLMLAQDTGGAISGAVRADYFWGHGVKAFTQASQMKEGGRMWLLLPKNQKISPKISGTLLRGVSGQTAECVVPDPEFCVE